MAAISKYFSLYELTRTDTGLRNQPDDAEMDNLRRTAHLMDAVRDLLGHPVIVHSGYRSPEVNKAVRGVATSAHCQGYAVDFVCPDFGGTVEVADRIADSSIKFDQLIREYGWVHISFAPALREMKMTKRSAETAYELGINA